MKKLLCIFLVLLCIIPTVSCRKEPSIDDAPKEKPLSYDIKKHTEDVMFNGKDYGDIKLLYPELEGAENINTLLFDIAKRHCDTTLPNLSSYDTDTMPEVTYEVTEVSITYLSNTFLSAKVDGTLTVSLASHPEPFVYTLNIDLEEVREINSGEVVKNFDGIKELFKKGNFSYEYGDKTLLAETNFEDMIMQYYSEYEIYPHFYFTEDKLCMNIELVYALGSNAGYSVSLKEAKNYLNTDNKEISKITE